jgi:diguanylate cyclase (GGDEF)-like protein
VSVDFRLIGDYNQVEMKEIYRDELTDCYNRRYLHHWIENEIKRAKRFDTKFSLILLDIDDFRRINNSFGHLEGDRVLVKFAEFLRSNIREVDSIVRYGGDEFVVLLPNSDAEGALELGQRIINKLNSTELRSHTIHCSIGISVFPDDATKGEGLFAHADDLMYQAKQQGKNRLGVRRKAMRRLRIPSPVTIGRDDETNWCLSQFKDHNMIFIAGAAGIGKTRLVFEIKDRLNTQIMARGNAYEALSSVAYHPFKNMFNELINREFPRVQQTFRILEEVYQAELTKLLPAEGIFRASYNEELDKYRLYHAVSEFILKLAETVYPGTMIVFIDDLHWADRSSVELLDFLMRRVTPSIKVLGTYRVEEMKNAPLSDYWGIWARDRLYTQIRLSPLNEDQTDQLLQAIMGTVPAALNKAVYNESGGNPFFIEEILTEFRRRRKIYWNGHEWVFAKGVAAAVPSTIAETIRRKMEMLLPETADFLKITAVYGQEFSPEIIAVASKRNVGQIMEAIDELIRLGFIKSRGTETYFFAEDVVRQFVYKDITRAELMQFHKAVGEAIEIVFHNVLPNYYEQLAHHFSMARDAVKSLFYSKKAALKARDNYAHSLAVKYYESALKYEDKIDQIFKIHLELADIYASTGNYSRALKELRVCLKIDPHSYRVYEKLGSVYEQQGEYKRSLKYYEKGMKITHGTPSVYIFRAAAAWLYARMGQYRRARQECEDILRRKRQMSSQTLADTYIILGVVLLRLGKFNRAERYFKNGLRIRKSIGDKKNIAACYVDLGLNYQGKFDIRTSERFFNKALSIYQEVGYQEGILITLNNLGVMYASYDLPKAEAYCLEALSKAKLIGAKRTIVLLYNNIGMISHNRLMDEPALASFRKALKLAKEIDFYEGIIFASISLSELHREKANVQRGRAYLRDAVRVARQIKVKFLNIDCLMEEIEYQLRRNRYTRAEELVRRMTAQLRAEQNALYRIYNYLYQARIFLARGKYAQAHRNLSRAFEYVKSLPENKISGEIHYLKGLTYKKEGKPQQALKMFLEADRVFKKIGNLRYVERIEKEIAGRA